MLSTVSKFQINLRNDTLFPFEFYRKSNLKENLVEKVNNLNVKIKIIRSIKLHEKFNVKVRMHSNRL
jgi:hypothetical protein